MGDTVAIRLARALKSGKLSEKHDEILWGNLRMNWHLLQVEEEVILRVTSCHRNRDKFPQLDEPRGSIADLTFPLKSPATMKFITGWITHAFWLVFTHDLLEERRIDDVTSNTFLLLDCMKHMSSMLPCVLPEIDYRRQNVVTLVCASWATFLFSQNLEVICDPQLNRRTAWNLFVNPLHPNISMHILHTVLNTFPEVLIRRICLTI